MSPTIIPYILMLLMVASNTFVLYKLNKKRDALDVDFPEQAAQAKKLRTITLVLYFQMAFMTAIIWLVIAPVLVPVDN